MIAEDDLVLFDFAETAEEAWDCLVQKGLTVRGGGPKDI
jgi:hypothetical protein